MTRPTFPLVKGKKRRDMTITERLLSIKGPIRIFHAGNEPFVTNYGGRSYVFPPDGRYVDPTTGDEVEADGILEMTDHNGWEWARLNEDGPMVNTGRVTTYHTARQAAEHILRKHEKRGLVDLTGDPTVDAGLIAEARLAFEKFQVAWAKQKLADYSNYLRAFHSDPSNAGNAPDPMGDSQIKAQEIMDAFRDGAIGQVSAFRCEHDGYHTNDQEKFNRHVRVAHPLDETTTTKRGRKAKSADA